MNIFRLFPYTLVLSRFVIGIIIILNRKNKKFVPFFLPLFTYNFFSDFLDGVICRQLGGFPLSLNIADGYGDISTFGSAALYLWCNSEKFRSRRNLLFLLVFAQLLSWIFCFIKFGKLTSYHAYTTKIWGIFMFFSVIETAHFKTTYLFPIMIISGLISNIEEIAITYTMPYWKNNIVSLRMANRIAVEYKKGK